MPELPMANYETLRRVRLGYAADPAIDVLLDKKQLIKIKILQLQHDITVMEGDLALAKQTLNMLEQVVRG